MNGDQNPDTPPAGWQFHPGDTVTPQPEASIADPAPGSSQPTDILGAAGQAAISVGQIAEQEPQVLAEPPVEQAQPEVADEEAVTWSASEYIAHQKTLMWYMVLAVVALALATAAYFLTKDITSAASIVIIAAIFGMYGAHKPRVLDYKLDAGGLTIAQKFYAYGSFRSFAVIQEGSFSSIVLVPLKRFMPLLTVYYSPQDEDKIVQMIADRLPLEERKPDAIDSFMHKIRF